MNPNSRLEYHWEKRSKMERERVVFRYSHLEYLKSVSHGGNKRKKDDK